MGNSQEKNFFIFEERMWAGPTQEKKYKLVACSLWPVAWSCLPGYPGRRQALPVF